MPGSVRRVSRSTPTRPHRPAGRLPFDDLGGYRAEIDQATGILMVQLDVGFEEAFIRLRAHAYARGTRISVVAADVVAHRLRLPGHGSVRHPTTGDTAPRRGVLMLKPHTQRRAR